MSATPTSLSMQAQAGPRVTRVKDGALLQRVEALTCCPECGVHYTRGSAPDERMHAQLHERHRSGVRLPAWQNMRLASASARLCHEDDRILVILPGDPPKHVAKVREVCDFMEASMGCPARWITQVPVKVFLYVRKQLVVGLLAMQALPRSQRTFAIPAPRAQPQPSSAADAGSAASRACSGHATQRPANGHAAKPARPTVLADLWHNAANRAAVSEPTKHLVAGMAACAALDAAACSELELTHAPRQAAAPRDEPSRGTTCGGAAAAEAPHARDCSAGGMRAERAGHTSLPTDRRRPRSDEGGDAPQGCEGAGGLSLAAVKCCGNKCGRGAGEALGDATGCRRAQEGLDAVLSEGAAPGSAWGGAQIGDAPSISGAATASSCRQGCDTFAGDSSAAAGDGAPDAPATSARQRAAECGAVGSSHIQLPLRPCHRAPRRRGHRLSSMVAALHDDSAAAAATGSESDAACGHPTAAPHENAAPPGGAVPADDAVTLAHALAVRSAARLDAGVDEAPTDAEPGVTGTSALAPIHEQARNTRGGDASKPAALKQPRAVVGVRALWVSVMHRRQGIATKLVDAARFDCMRGYVSFRNEVAFTQPCDEGVRFAAKYCGTESVLLFSSE